MGAFTIERPATEITKTAGTFKNTITGGQDYSVTRPSTILTDAATTWEVGNKHLAEKDEVAANVNTPAKITSGVSDADFIDDTLAYESDLETE